jgi:hypothetical protein
MTADEFWQAIGEAAHPDPYRHAERVVARLAKGDVDDIIDFDLHWTQARSRAYTAPLWGAATLIQRRPVLDDAFEYFRAWLVLQGQQAYDRAVADPDSLADVIRCDDGLAPSFEGCPAYDAWLIATGSLHDPESWDAWVRAAEARHGAYGALPDLAGRLEDDADGEASRQRLLRLSTLFAADGRARPQ